MVILWSSYGDPMVSECKRPVGGWQKSCGRTVKPQQISEKVQIKLVIWKIITIFAQKLLNADQKIARETWSH